MHATKLTQAQAARAAGVTRTSIWRAVRRGRLSAERMNDGSLRIDASELLRVYPQADLARVANGSDNRTGTRSRDERTVTSDAAGHGELDALRAFIDELKRDKERLQRELEASADERVRVLTMLEEERREVKLLTAARTPKKSWWKKFW